METVCTCAQERKTATRFVFVMSPNTKMKGWSVLFITTVRCRELCRLHGRRCGYWNSCPAAPIPGLRLPFFMAERSVSHLHRVFGCLIRKTFGAQLSSGSGAWRCGVPVRAPDGLRYGSRNSGGHPFGAFGEWSEVVGRIAAQLLRELLFTAADKRVDQRVKSVRVVFMDGVAKLVHDHKVAQRLWKQHHV